MSGFVWLLLIAFVWVAGSAWLLGSSKGVPDPDGKHLVAAMIWPIAIVLAVPMCAVWLVAKPFLWLGERMSK